MSDVIDHRGARMNEVYIVGDWESGGVVIQCERDQCRVPGNCSAGLCWWTSEPIYHATLNKVAAVMADHITTHTPLERKFG
jgi:hypothetical protein